MIVNWIENGVVIDHIPPGRASVCLSLLRKKPLDKTTIVATRLQSRCMGSKDMIKIWDYDLDDEDLEVISIIAPEATFNRIRDKEVVEKKKAKPPSRVVGRLECINPSCATREEHYLESKFSVDSLSPLRLKCDYCERLLVEESIRKQLGV